jgi:integral membrane protein
MAFFSTGPQAVLPIIMFRLLQTKTGRLRIVGMLEGISLLLLLFIAMPMKYMFDNPSGSRFMGPVHGALFLLFIFNTISVGVEQGWKFRTTTWKVLLACIIPFGTFYIDKQILGKIGSASKTEL